MGILEARSLHIGAGVRVITLLYGQPGTGKSTLSTGIILDHLRQGRRVVSNYPVDAAPGCIRANGELRNASVEVLPSRPSFEVLSSIGIGWSNPADFGREDRSGLLVIDECGPWLSSRKWNDKERDVIIDWLLHSRKRGWDIVLIAQAPGLVDKQVREAVIESYARCRRSDRMKVPFIGVKLPRFHIAVARYGLDQNAPVLERWVYRGAIEHKCYQSYALFDAVEENGVYCTLPPRLTRWAGHKSIRERLAAWFAPPAVSLKPKLPLVEMLANLSPDQALKHWRRLDALGAFQVRPVLPLAAAGSGL